MISRFAGETLQPGRFLDVGCGSGSTVRAAADLGWEAAGIDIDARLVQLGRDKLNVDLRNSSLPESGFEANHFNFIRLRNVIGHLPNPYDVLVEARRLLVPGGIIMIATINQDGLPAQVRRLMGGKRTIKFPPYNVHGFAAKTLKRILERSGLKVIEITSTTPFDLLYGTARNAQFADRTLHVMAWRLGKALGMGSTLVGWAKK